MKPKAKVEKIKLFGGGSNFRVRALTTWGWSELGKNQNRPFDSRREAEDWAIDNGYHLIGD